jgi:hypothetical protein
MPMQKTKSLVLLFICFIGQVGAQTETGFVKKAELIYQHELTKTGYCSDGSDRARNNQPRFAGAMEARLLTFDNYQYVSYYEANGDIVVARRNVLDTVWEKAIINGYKIESNDRHNKISMAISEGDGVIHLSFDHHNTPKLNYARSAAGVAKNPGKVKWDNGVFQLLPNLGFENDMGLITYPSFYSLKKSGDLILYWRTGGAISGEMNLAHYNSKNQLWSFIGQISSAEGHYNGFSGTRGPYHAGFQSNSKGDIEVAWVWRESYNLQHPELDVVGNHGLFYAKSTDGGDTWRNNNNVLVASVDKKMRISIDNIGEPVVEIPIKLDASNSNICSAIDYKTDEFHFISSHKQADGGKKIPHHYVRKSNGSWTFTKTELPVGGCRLFFSDDVLLYLVNNGIYWSERSTGFSEWNPIKLDVETDSGEVNWDVSRLGEGIISMVMQHNPKKMGEPSPVSYFEYKIEKLSR